MPYEQGLRKAQTCYLTYAILNATSYGLITAFGFYGYPSLRPLFDSFCRPLPTDETFIQINRVLTIAFITLATFLSTLTLAFFMTICRILCKEFEYLSRAFSMKIGPTGKFSDDLERMRYSHQRRCQLVEDADALLKTYVANAYFANVSDQPFGNQISNERLVKFSIKISSIRNTFSNTILDWIFQQYCRCY